MPYQWPDQPPMDAWITREPEELPCEHNRADWRNGEHGWQVLECPDCEAVLVEHEPQCSAADEETETACQREPTRIDGQGHPWCGLHEWLAYVSGEMTYPIEASEHERAQMKRDVENCAATMLADLRAGKE
jgi:hypothetical protein